MTPLFVRAVILAGLLVGPASAMERIVEKAFPVSAGGALKVDTYRGGITVEESDGAEVRVSIRIELPTEKEDEAARLIEALQLEIKAEGDAVSIQARNPRDSQVRFVWNDKKQIDLAYKITVPRRCDVDLATLNGSVTVGNLTGTMKVRAERGTVFFRRIDGSVSASTQQGDLIVSRCTGAVKLETLQGSVRVGLVGGRAELETASGDIEIQNAKGGVTAMAERGDVSAGFSRGFTGDATITTAAGNIFATIDPAADATIRASSVWGKVEATLPVTVETGGVGKSKLGARLNRGGPVLTLHASGGHVKLAAGLPGVE